MKWSTIMRIIAEAIVRQRLRTTTDAAGWLSSRGMSGPGARLDEGVNQTARDICIR
jgi:hypothetical protein